MTKAGSKNRTTLAGRCPRTCAKTPRPRRNRVRAMAATANGMADETDILIIGAGAAGLAAARELSAANFNVIVLEARDRIGGRIYTHPDSQLTAPIELGAEF